MRKFLMTVLVVLLLAAAAAYVVKDEEGRPYLFSLLKVGEPGSLLPGSMTAYKWQDDQGNWHYADQAPEGADAERVHVDTPTVAPEPPADEAEKKGMLSHLPGVFKRAHEAGERMNEDAEALKGQLDEAAGQ